VSERRRLRALPSSSPHEEEEEYAAKESSVEGERSANDARARSSEGTVNMRRSEWR